MAENLKPAPLRPMTALGHAAPAVHEIGPYRIAERFDVALASLAVRQGADEAVVKAAATLGLTLPPPARHQAGTPLSAFWVAPGMWFVEAPFATHEDIVATLKPAFGAAASITEQTDAWVRFDLSAPDLLPLMERLTNLDLPRAEPGLASRTVIEHLGCYLIHQGRGAITLYGPRSAADSLLHALETAAKSVI